VNINVIGFASVLPDVEQILTARRRRDRTIEKFVRGMAHATPEQRH
jgi:hypothetical protein